MNLGPAFSPAKSALFGVLGAVLFPALLAAQTVLPENWALDYDEKTVVAVLPLAGDDAGVIRRFQEKIMEAVALLEEYSPREVRLSALAGVEPDIPTDMPPVRLITADARYALTGGVYPGGRTGEYYLQLWLWDMADSTIIYTDDLVYDDINEAMMSVPGLVEWLFSHIREITITTPAAEFWPDPIFALGVRAGLDPRWYISSGEISPGAWALNLEGGVSGALRLNSLFCLQLEALVTHDRVVYRGLGGPGKDFIENEKFSSLTMTIPLLAKMNFKIRRLRLSPLAGVYAMFPLGNTRYDYHHSAGDGTESYSWSYTVPLGFAVGLEGALPYGPGRVYAGLRYAGDFGNVNVDGGGISNHHGNYGDTISHKRQTFSLYLGYEFGFLEGKKLEDF